MKQTISAIFATLILTAASTSLAHAYASDGQASYYGGRGRTASGGHVGAMTAAHKTLPFGTVLRVTNMRNQRSAVVTVNDRGPFVRGRIVDVSVGAAHALGMHSSGIASVHIEVVGRGSSMRVADASDVVAPQPAIASDAAPPDFFAALFAPPAPVLVDAPAPVRARRHHRR